MTRRLAALALGVTLVLVPAAPAQAQNRCSDGMVAIFCDDPRAQDRSAAWQAEQQREADRQEARRAERRAEERAQQQLAEQQRVFQQQLDTLSDCLRHGGRALWC